MGKRYDFPLLPTALHGLLDEYLKGNRTRIDLFCELRKVLLSFFICSGLSYSKWKMLMIKVVNCFENYRYLLLRIKNIQR